MRWQAPSVILKSRSHEGCQNDVRLWKRQWRASYQSLIACSTGVGGLHGVGAWGASDSVCAINKIKLVVAFWSQGTAFLRKRCPSQSCAAMVPSYKCQLSDAEALMFALHRKLLSAGSGKANRHFQGVRQVERHFRAALSPKSRRWLCNLDTAFGVMRHITQQSADSCLEAFLNEIQVHDETVDLASLSSTAEAASELEGYISGDSSGKVSSKFGPPFESIEMQEEEFYHINVKDTAVQADMFSSGSWEEIDLTGNDIVDGFKFVVMQALNNVEACQGRVSNLIGPNVLASSSPYDGV